MFKLRIVVARQPLAFHIQQSSYDSLLSRFVWILRRSLPLAVKVSMEYRLGNRIGSNQIALKRRKL
jgi:hypothetical protein